MTKGLLHEIVIKYKTPKLAVVRPFSYSTNQNLFDTSLTYLGTTSNQYSAMCDARGRAAIQNSALIQEG